MPSRNIYLKTLAGTYKPHAIPVNVYIGYQQNTNALFDSAELMQGSQSLATQPGMPQIMMTFESRDSSSPSQVQVVVSLDSSRPKGVRVDVNGTLPFTIQQIDHLEETARRGGLFALPGKLWTWQ